MVQSTLTPQVTIEGTLFLAEVEAQLAKILGHLSLTEQLIIHLGGHNPALLGKAVMTHDGVGHVYLFDTLISKGHLSATPGTAPTVEEIFVHELGHLNHMVTIAGSRYWSTALEESYADSVAFAFLGHISPVAKSVATTTIRIRGEEEVDFHYEILPFTTVDGVVIINYAAHTVLYRSEMFPEQVKAKRRTRR